MAAVSSAGGAVTNTASTENAAGGAVAYVAAAEETALCCSDTYTAAAAVTEKGFFVDESTGRVEGFMLKTGRGFLARSRRRYFRLDPARKVLEYFEGPSSQTPKGSIDLSRASSVQARSASLGASCFAITTPNREWILTPNHAAKSSARMNWQKHIQDVIRGNGK